jgi:hypothetical protein
MLTKDQLRVAILSSFKDLIDVHRQLFNCSIGDAEDHVEGRKLHEVCVNHQLANILHSYISGVEANGTLFTDIEFNKEGDNPKTFSVNGKSARPDIIVHNRKSGADKLNILVIECKKEGADNDTINRDSDKLRRFINDPKFAYQFGLRVLYGNNGIQAELFFRNGTNIESEPLDYPERKA